MKEAYDEGHVGAAEKNGIIRGMRQCEPSPVVRHALVRSNSFS